MNNRIFMNYLVDNVAPTYAVKIIDSLATKSRIRKFLRFARILSLMKSVGLASTTLEETLDIALDKAFTSASSKHPEAHRIYNLNQDFLKPALLHITGDAIKHGSHKTSDEIKQDLTSFLQRQTEYKAKIAHSNLDVTSLCIDFRSALLRELAQYQTPDGILTRSLVQDAKHEILEVVEDIQESINFVSSSLDIYKFREIGMKSLNRHKSKFPPVHEEIYIRRTIESNLLKEIRKGKIQGFAIEGFSGCGKSTLVRSLGETAITRETGVAIWLDAQNIEDSTSLNSILYQTIFDIDASFQSHSVNDIYRFSSELPDGLIVIIDDVNRTGNPEKIIKLVNRWIISIKDEMSSFRPKISFLIPIWLNLQLKQKELDNFIFADVGNFNEEEQKSLSQEQKYSHHKQVREILKMIDGDPFLAGLFLANPSLFGYQNKRQVMKSTLQNYVEMTVHAIKENKPLNERNLTVSLQESLTALSIAGLETPEPLLSSIDSSHHDVIRLWSKNRNFGWLKENNDGFETWVWRHNRLRDLVLGRLIADLYQAKKNSELLNRTKKNLGLANAFAMSTIYFDEDEVNSFIDEILESQPLMLVEALRTNLFTVDESHLNMLRDTLKSYLEIKLVEITPYIVNEALYRLMDTTNGQVLDALDGIGFTYTGHIAKISNGDTIALIEYLNRVLKHEFQPILYHPKFENALKNYITITQREHEIPPFIVKSLNDEVYLNEIFIIAGYLQWEALAASTLSYWDTLIEEKKIEYLLPFIWMMSRCTNHNNTSYLSNAIGLIAKVSDEKKESGSSDRGNLRFYLDALFRTRDWKITDAAAEAWLHSTQKNENIQDMLYSILRVIDHPTTIEAFVKWHASLENKYLYPGGDIIANILPRNNTHREVIVKNIDTRNKLWEIISSDAEDSVRKEAFVYWLHDVKANDLHKLQMIDSDDSLIDWCLQERFKLGDETAFQYLLDYIKDDPVNYLEFTIFYLHISGVDDVIVNNIHHLLDDWRSVEIFLHLPEILLDKIIEQKSEILRKNYRSWYWLWRANTLESLQFVYDHLQGCVAPEDNLKHFFSRGGSPFEVSKDMLNCITPHLQLLIDSGTRMNALSRSAMKSGYHDWVQNVLLPLSPAEDLFIRIESQDKVFEILNQATSKEISREHIRNVDYFYSIIHSDNRHDFLVDIHQAVREWLQQMVLIDDRSLIIASIVLYRIGTDEDFDWWQEYEPSKETDSYKYWVSTRDRLLSLKWQH
ncbi:MAG: hypothetical protein AAF846_23220 [Chloroflexota bacterium]